MNYIQYITGLELDSKEGPALHRPGWWAMLSTMKFAIWILIILGGLSLASMFSGELVKPEMLDKQTSTSLGAVGRLLFLAFDMADPFRSWWYRGLIGLLCLSLFACVLERTPIIWRLWTRKPSTDTSWVKDVQSAIVREPTLSDTALKQKLGARFNWRVSDGDVWIGEHGRFGMWGPLATHIGLLLLGLGALVTSFGGIRTHEGAFAGETIKVDQMPFEVRVDSFRVQYYPLQIGQVVLAEGEWLGTIVGQNSDSSWQVERWVSETEKQYVALWNYDLTNHWDNSQDRGNVKRFVSYVTLFEDGQEDGKTEIAVNSPLRRSGFRLYQSSYDPEHPRIVAGFDSVTLVIVDTTGKEVGQLLLRPGKPAKIPGDTLTVTAGRLLPDFKMDQSFKAYSASDQFSNPALELSFSGPNGYDKGHWSFVNFSGHGRGVGKYLYHIADLRGEHASAEFATIFEIKRTRGTEFLWLGFVVSTIGLILCFYVTHRVVYVEWSGPARARTRLIGITRKTSHLYENDLDRLIGAPALTQEAAETA
jgi:cytochrome c biogenesis protein